MNDEELLEKFKMNVAIDNFRNEYTNEHTLNREIKWRGYSMRKKLIAGLCGCLLLVSGAVLANYNKIVASFRFGKGIDSAAQNGYVASPDMNYVGSNTIVNNQAKGITLNNINVNAKIEDFLMDDLTIGTHFTFEIDTKINDTIDLDSLQRIVLKDLIITDEENKILYCMDEDAFEKYCKENNLDYQFMEFNENYYNCGLNDILSYHDKESGLINFNYNIYSGDKSFPKSKKLNFKFTEIQLETNENLEGENNVVNLKGTWNINLNVPKEMYNRKSISYKVVSCEHPDFQVTNATLTNTGFELGIIISNMPRTEEPQILKELSEKTMRGEISFDEYYKKINTEEELVEANKQYFKEEHPIAIVDWDNPGNENIENVTYVENEKGEKFESTLSPGRRQDANFIDGNKFSFYETFGLTTYTATNKLKVRVMFKDKPYIIELEKATS